MDIVETVCARFCGRFLMMLLAVVAGCANPGEVVDLDCEPPPPFSPSGEVIPPDRWWLEFDDSELNRYVNQAFNGSFTLSAAMQRLVAARAVARREASDLFPDLDGVADMGGFFGPGRDRGVFTTGLEASYQVDLWGQIESRVEAERLRAAATHADYHAIALVLSAEVTRTWFALIESRAQLALLDDQIKTNKIGLSLQESRFALGQIRSADVLRQRQLVESTLEQSVIVNAQIEVLEHQMAVLLGQPAQQVSYTTGIDLPQLPPLPATGLPSDLLNRRPDVRRDYLEFVAADRDLAAAITDQYPRLNLAGSLLTVTERPETLFRDWFVTVGAQMIGPIVDGGQRRAEVDRTTAVTRLRFDEYGQTVLNAFREVEDALALERYQLERIEYLERQVELARLASEQLREQYLIGDTDYLNVLSAITTQQRLQRDTLSARLELLLIRISLYLALAGSFEPCQQDFTGFQEMPMLLEEPASVLEEDGTPMEELPEPVPVPFPQDATPKELPSPDLPLPELTAPGLPARDAAEPVAPPPPAPPPPAPPPPAPQTPISTPAKEEPEAPKLNRPSEIGVLLGRFIATPRMNVDE